jgi:hypothetical protein
VGKRVVMLLLAVLAMAAAGCGGDDGDDSGNSANAGDSGGAAETRSDEDGASDEDTTTSSDSQEPLTASSLSKAQFIEKANAICTSRVKQIETELASSQKGGAGSGNPDEAAVVEIALPGIQAEIEEIQALGAPRGDVEEVEAFLTVLQSGLDLIDRQAQPTVQGFVGALDSAEKAASKYGLEACPFS